MPGGGGKPSAAVSRRELASSLLFNTAVGVGCVGVFARCVAEGTMGPAKGAGLSLWMVAFVALSWVRGVREWRGRAAEPGAAADTGGRTGS